MKKKELAKFEKEIEEKFNSELKKNLIKNIMIGFNTANQMILDYIDNGHNLDEVKEFCLKNVEKKDIVENIISDEKKDSEQ